MNKWADGIELTLRQNATSIQQTSVAVQALTQTSGPSGTSTSSTASSPTQTDVTSLRTFGGGPYGNSGSGVLGVSYTISSSGGLGGTATVTISGGSVTTYGTCAANAVGGVDSSTMFTFFVLPGQSYNVTRDVHIIILNVVETAFEGS